MSHPAEKSFKRQYHTVDFAYEDRVFDVIFLFMLLLGAGVSQYLQHVRIQRPVYVPRPGPIRVAEVILREPELTPPPPQLVVEKVAKPGGGVKLSKEEIRKRSTSPPPLSAVGSPRNLPEGEGASVKKMVARKGLLGLLSKTESDPELRAYQPSKKKKDVSDELNQALKNLSGSGRRGVGEEDDFLGVGNVPEVAKKGTDIGYILNAAKIGAVRETQVEFYGGTEDLPERRLEDLPGEVKAASEDGISVEGKPGGRTYSQIRKIVASYLGGLRYLYNKELRVNPSLRGKITVAFEISPDGKVVQSILMGSSFGSHSFEQMVLDNIRKWKFPSIPEQNGLVKVTYPFVFLPPSS